MTHSVDLHDATGTIISVAGAGILQAHGETVPTDGASGYMQGCLFIKTGVVGVTGVLFRNVGTNESCDFDQMV